MRVCFNRLKVQERNNRIMQKQFHLSELLLGRLLPPDIVQKLKEAKENNVELAEDYSGVTILFCDMVGFTKFSSDLDPGELMSFLSELYARYSKVRVCLNILYILCACNCVHVDSLVSNTVMLFPFWITTYKRIICRSLTGGICTLSR